MPIRDDFILRMLDQIAEVLAKVVLGATGGAAEEAERSLATAYQELTGSNRDLVAQLGTDQLLAILGAPLNFNRERGYVLGRLLEADAEVSRLTSGGDGAFTDVARLKALDLYLASAAAGLQEDDLEEHIDGMLHALADVYLPVPSAWRVFEHAWRTQRFAKAEDQLYELLEREGADEELARRGRAFYADLGVLPDETLLAGGLPRDEVQEGQRTFNERVGGGQAAAATDAAPAAMTDAGKDAAPDPAPDTH